MGNMHILLICKFNIEKKTNLLKGEKENANEPQKTVARFRVSVHEFLLNSKCTAL
ncbi:unknown protein [Simkania negevensis Z]|uniref:Uncharacterized protein n=1 Tax=Simkania negevensis (strain ATCC VR-1471 / DSM 27360 / Z) TaxID=331113 RepID=F8L609_SIMNZ|nr:unknown protein [Simkania negevensis Z]